MDSCFRRNDVIKVMADTILPPLALYIHWPFCKKKCPYCDFNSHVREGVDHARWRNALLSELRYMHSLAPNHLLTSIFFGGGTPSLMQAETVAALIEQARGLWPAAENLEITLEANPTSVEAATFPAFKDAGVNRVSLGIQSLRQEALTFLGREHSADEALRALEFAAQHFTRYSFDLIYALPGQTLPQWEQELQEALRFAGGHLSLYQLTIEPNTAFYHAFHAKKSFAMPDEETAAAFYERTQEMMEAAGLPAYEISNHAKPGEEARHNLSYWRGEAYAGVGPGAHGRLSLPPCGGGLGWGGGANGRAFVPYPPPLPTSPTRGEEYAWHATLTHKTPELWLDKVDTQGHGLESRAPLTLRERMEERLMMGLRLREGLRFATLSAQEREWLTENVATQQLEMLQREGLLEIEAECWRATRRGSLVLHPLLGEMLR
jgi:putative oxygen-independent coproporphyrinogen III oxidase